MAVTPPRPTPRDLINQFVTLLLLIVALSISLTFLFVQTPPPAQSSAATIVMVWEGMRPDMVAANLTPRLLDLGDSGLVALDHHAVFPTTPLVQAATLATGDTPGSGDSTISSSGSGVIPSATASAATGTGVTADAPYWVFPGTTPVSTPIPTSTPAAPPSATPALTPVTTSTTTPDSTPTPAVSPDSTPTPIMSPPGTPSPTVSPIGTPTSTVSPGSTPTPSAGHGVGAVAGIQPLTEASVLTAAQTALPGGVIVPPTLATTLTQAGLSISYEGTGGQALLPALSAVTHQAAQAYVIDDAVVYPASLQADLAAQSPPSAEASQAANFTQIWLHTLQPKLNATHKPYLSVIAIPDIMRAAAAHGLGSPEHLAAIRDADTNLGVLLDALNQEGQLSTTNIIVTSDHGLLGTLAPGSQQLVDQTTTAPSPSLATNVASLMRQEAQRGSAGLLPHVGADGVATAAVTATTTVVVAPQGGADLISLPETAAVQAVGGGDAAKGRIILAGEIAAWVQAQPWAGPIFVADSYGPIGGTLPLSDVALAGPRAPALAVTFAAQPNDVAPPSVNPQAYAGSGYADTTQLATSGGLSRREIHTIFYALGPSFRTHVRDLAPTGATDLAPTIVRLLGLPDLKSTNGRVLSEMLTGATDTLGQFQTFTQINQATRADGTTFFELVQIEQIGNTSYIGAAGTTIGQKGESNSVLQQRILTQLGP